MAQHHSCDIELAGKYGLAEAMIIHHFQHWIRVNRKMKRNFHEGRYWSYQTLDEIAAHFPYLSKSQVCEIITKLCLGKGRRSKKEQEFEPVLLKGNFNKHSYDQTVWYTFVREDMYTSLAQAKMDDSSSQTGCQPEPTPIPDTKPNTKPDTKTPPLPSSPKSHKATKEEEEEEINLRLKNRPTNCKPIVSVSSWKAKVLHELRMEKAFSGFSDESFLVHKMEANKYDLHKFGDWTVYACPKHVEFTSGSQIDIVNYSENENSWRIRVEKYWGRSKGKA